MHSRVWYWNASPRDHHAGTRPPFHVYYPSRRHQPPALQAPVDASEDCRRSGEDIAAPLVVVLGQHGADGGSGPIAVIASPGIRESVASAGAHTWTNWREYLDEFAPLLFR